MSNLLAPLDLSYLGKPSEERLALDRLGGFSQRNLIETYQQGKVKKFIIEYVGFGDLNLRICYSEKAGQTTMEYYSFLEKLDE